MRRKQIIRTPWIEDGVLVGLKLDGQPYRFVGVGFEKRQDESLVEVSRWRSNCWECGVGIDVYAPLDREGFGLSRRCRDCASPGRRAA
ncbi:MAG: hypothetical protein AAGH38_00495 [Pseudomonadota bacterium]